MVQRFLPGLREAAGQGLASELRIGEKFGQLQALSQTVEDHLEEERRAHEDC